MIDRTIQNKPKYVHNPESPIHSVRLAVQVAFALICVWIGIEFHVFVTYLESGGTTTFVNRPPGVEGFLPIASLMSLYHYILTGEIHPVHPAGFFLLVAFITLSFVFGKAFCSWICPIGLLSEYVGNLSEKIFKGRIVPRRVLDYPLRGLKYLLLGFFVFAIFFAMNGEEIRAFLDSPYNKVADVKMYYFFANITRFASIVILSLLVLSFAIRHFWCRYLCPYGALLGILTVLSPSKIVRNKTTCIDCGKCAQACPVLIKVDKAGTVVSDECTSCLDCLDSCPVAHTLEVKFATRRKIPKSAVAVGVIIIYFGVTGVGRLTGHWRNDIPISEYLFHQDRLDSYGHPGGSSGIVDLETPEAGLLRKEGHANE
jgi:polyferredoxin